MTGRPLSGSIRHQNGMWVASVPRRKGGRPRTSCSFPDRGDAQVWIDEQIERLHQGLEAQAKPLKERRKLRAAAVEARAVAAIRTAASEPAGAPLRFAEVARSWHYEQYVALQRAEVDRAKAVLDDIEIHLIPAFESLLELDFPTGRKQVITWVRVMAGYPPEPGGDSTRVRGIAYAKTTVSGLLEILAQVLAYAAILGADVKLVPAGPRSAPALLEGISAMEPVDQEWTSVA